MHTVPAITFVLNFLITDVAMKHSHSKIIPVVGAIYGYVNYKETLARGEPLYWFLDWKDEKSALIVVGLTIVTWLAYHLLTAIT